MSDVKNIDIHNILSLYVLEWNQTEGHFHITTLGSAVEDNFASYVRGDSVDYKIIGVYKTFDEANDTSKELERIKSEQGG